MRELFVGVTTSPRPEPYLLDTLRSLFAAGQSVRPRVTIAPTFHDPSVDWDHVRAAIGPAGRVIDPLFPGTAMERATSLGATCPYNAAALHRGLEHNYDRLLKTMLASTTAIAAPMFLILQDDVVLCRRAADRIAEVMDYVGKRSNSYLGIGACSFYTPYSGAGASRTALWNYGGDSFYGECALLWNRSCAVDFLGFSNTSNAHDLEIARYFRTRPRFRLMAHSPCLVQHVGVSSATGKSWTDGHQRQTMNFKPDHDAIRNAKPW